MTQARLRKLLALERAARRLARATERAKDGRDCFPDSRDLNARLAAAVEEAFVNLLTVLEWK